MLVEGDEWLPPRDETGTSGIGPGEPVDSSWLRAPAGDQRPPQSEFFQPPPVQKGGIPDDWFLDGTAPGPADPPRPMPSVSPPPQAASLSSRLPGAMSAEVAVDELRGHVTALHAAVTAVLDWLPPDLAAEAARLFQTTYGATRFR